jgi:hypothetical protein
MELKIKRWSFIMSFEEVPAFQAFNSILEGSLKKISEYYDEHSDEKVTFDKLKEIVGTKVVRQKKPSDPNRPKCEAMQQNNKECKNFAVEGTHLCSKHSKKPVAPPPAAKRTNLKGGTKSQYAGIITNSNKKAPILNTTSGIKEVATNVLITEKNVRNKPSLTPSRSDASDVSESSENDNEESEESEIEIQRPIVSRAPAASGMSRLNTNRTIKK